MKLLSILILLLAMPPQNPVKKKVVFFGDSITQAGVKPGGYITKIEELAEKEQQAGNYEFIGAGIGGNKIYDLYLRVEEDVLSQNPDIVVIYIGVNDVWHKALTGTGTDFDKFEKFYNALIAKFTARNIKVILAKHAVIGERYDNTNQMDGDLNRYSELIRTLAQKHSLSLVDLRKGFLEYSKLNNPENKEQGILTTDRVHLNEKGNEFVAAEMWKAIRGVK